MEEHLLCICEILKLASSIKKNKNDNGISIQIIRLFEAKNTYIPSVKHMDQSYNTEDTQ